MSAGVLAEWALFLALSVVAIAGAAMMLLTMSMYRAGLFLMVSFLGLAGMFFLLQADLLAVIQVMMNVGGMMIMILFMVMLMIDPGGEMMWDMKRQMKLPGPGAFSMSMPRGGPPKPDSHTGEMSGGPPGGTPSGSTYTCPMHPEIVSTSPGPCPKCGMDLVPTTPPPAVGMPAEYTCPMHPEVVSAEPGKCPKCGMDLVSRTADEESDGGVGDVHEPPPAADIFSCPMHPEVRSDGPGKCPKCGMDLIPAAAETQPATDGSGEYTCPMHPEVRSDGPGKCPKCGMDLVPADPAEGTTAESGAAGETSETSQAMDPAAHHKMMVGMAMSTEQLPWALGLGLVSAAALSFLVLWTPWPVAPVRGPVGDATSAVGELLLGRYMMAFEGAAMLILAGIAGGVILGRREATPASARSPDTAGGASVHPAHGDEAMQHHTPAQPTDSGPSTGAGSVWTCPMHPEVRSDGPGKCPKCGMDLVPAESLNPPGGAHGG